MTAYILQAILFQLLFLLVYEILLKKETFFTYNRWYLLITTGLSLILPMIKIETLGLLVPAESLTQMSTIFLPEVFIGSGTAADSIEHLPAVKIESSASAISPWLVIYLLGVLTAIVILLKKYSDLSRMFRFKKVAAEGYVNIIEVPNSSIACTFYRTIFLGDQLSEAEKQQILSHELVHVKQKHSLDLVFFEVLKVIFWFNPLIYIYQNRIATVHEFIADAAVVQSTEKRSYYEQLLNSAFNTQNISFINQFFNHSLIKKRILMLQKSRSKSISKAKYLLLVPLMLLMLTIVACSEDIPEAITKDKSVSEQLAEIKEVIQSRDLTDAEKKEFYSIMDQVIKDYNWPPPPPPPPAPDTNNSALSEVVLQDNSGTADIPFAVIEQVPVYPGCENLTSNEEKKKCMSEKVQEFVASNFDTSLGKKLGLKGVNRVIAVFKISSEGNITDVRARAPHPDLETEAIRVIEGLPKMTPGVQKGQNVGVSYSLPIVFQVNE